MSEFFFNYGENRSLKTYKFLFFELSSFIFNNGPIFFLLSIVDLDLIVGLSRITTTSFILY